MAHGTEKGRYKILEENRNLLVVPCMPLRGCEVSFGLILWAFRFMADNFHDVFTLTRIHCIKTIICFTLSY